MIFPADNTIWQSSRCDTTQLRVIGAKTNEFVSCVITQGSLKGEVHNIHWMHFGRFWLSIETPTTTEGN